MAVRIRLQRKGKKGAPFYHIVAADQRSPRDGKYLEKLGTYNPMTQPATIEIDVDKTVNWLQKGATASETANAILKYKGVAYKNHLMNGVRKGAFKLEDVEGKFQAWMSEKEGKITGHSDKIKKAAADKKQAQLEAEKAINEKRKQAAEEAAKAEEEKVEATTEETTAETTTEVTDTPENQVEETPVAEVEEKVEEKTEETTEETKEDNPEA